MFEAIAAIAFIGTIVMQWHIITVYNDRITKLAKVIKEVQESKADREHTHSYIGGNLDMVYDGKRAPTFQAHIYPKRLK